MLSNLIYSLNAITPIIILVIIGIVFKKIGLISDSFASDIDRLVFKAALPVMLFTEVAQSNIAKSFDGKLIVFLIVSVSALFLVASLVTPLFVKDKAKVGAIVQGISRSNFAILGVPLAENLFGNDGVAAVAITMPFVILMFNTYSVIVLSVFSSENSDKLDGKAVKKILKNIATNPLIIGILLGVPFMLFGITIPTIPLKSLTYMKNLTTPLALMSLGANFRFESLKEKAWYSITASVMKTAIVPLIMIVIAAAIGIRDISLGTVLIVFGAPTAVSSYIMAKNMHSDGDLAAQIVLITTMMCAFTVFLGVFILKTLGLI